MGKSIAVMNTKGGVGKSTITVALAEALVLYHGKSVLVIDSDSQASASYMMMPLIRLKEQHENNYTLVGFLSNAVLGLDGPKDWKLCIADHVSDVDNTDKLYLVPNHMELTLIEREISFTRHHVTLRGVVRDMLEEAQRYVDIILIDCPPGLSILAETWLRECDYYLSPVKPDFLSVAGLEVLEGFKQLTHKMGFAQNIGVLVNMKDPHSTLDDAYNEYLINNPTNRCFAMSIPRLPPIQNAARFDSEGRSFVAKYPGISGKALRNSAQELLQRLAEQEAAHSNDSNRAYRRKLTE